MATGAAAVLPSFMHGALAASNVGGWAWDVEADHVVLDSVAARLFGIDPEEAERGVRLVRISAVVHPEDEGVYRRKVEHVSTRGGLIVVEYRTIPARGQVRWILGRGRYTRDAAGRMQGQGIVIDITESKLDGHIEEQAFFGTAQAVVSETPLVRAVDHAIATREAIDEITGPDHSILRKAVDGLLWALGRVLARHEAA